MVTFVFGFLGHALGGGGGGSPWVPHGKERRREEKANGRKEGGREGGKESTYPSAGLLHDEAHGRGLIEETELAIHVLLVRGVAEDAAVCQERERGREGGREGGR